MEHRVGSCSLCGGDVAGYRGVWMSILPPPPDRCTVCGAVAASDVIPMVPAPTQAPRVRTVTTTSTTAPRYVSNEERASLPKDHWMHPDEYDPDHPGWNEKR